MLMGCYNLIRLVLVDLEATNVVVQMKEGCFLNVYAFPAVVFLSHHPLGSIVQSQKRDRK